MNTEQKLQKEIDRLTRALKVAQDLNAGLEVDKDRAWELVQLMMARLPGHTFLLTPREMEDYDPRRWTVEKAHLPESGSVQFKLREK